jgi:hypothetical protein
VKSREEWIDEVRRRQDNIDPIRRIPNWAAFQGSLINGNQRLNTVQRVGALGAGLMALLTGFLGLAGIRSHSLGDSLYIVIFCPFSLWVGWKITMNALINDPTKHRRKKG